MIAIQKDTHTHLCIQLMNKDTHKDPFIQFKMSDGITYWTVVKLAVYVVIVNLVLYQQPRDIPGFRCRFAQAFYLPRVQIKH